MDKRRARYEQAERTTTAESKVKALRLEVADLRKDLYRAQETARLAQEELTARIAAHQQSRESLREALAASERRYADLFAAFEARGDALILATRPPAPIWRRLADRLGRPA